MHITTKLSSEEAEAFKVWSTRVKPPHVSEEDFYKQIFFMGIASVNKQLEEMARNMLKDEKVRNELASSGVDVELLEKELNKNNA